MLYEPTVDNYEDVAEGKVPTKPIYLTDCMLGLRSDDWRRQQLSLEALPEIVEKTANDLSMCLPELLGCLFRCQNKFEKAEFSIKKYNALVSVVNSQPRGSLCQIVARMKDSECGMGERLSLTETMVCSARMLSGEVATQPSEEMKQIMDKLKTDNQFFGIKSVFDEPMQKVGTVTKTSKSLANKKQAM